MEDGLVRKQAEMARLTRIRFCVVLIQSHGLSEFRVDPRCCAHYMKGCSETHPDLKSDFVLAGGGKSR